MINKIIKSCQAVLLLLFSMCVSLNLGGCETARTAEPGYKTMMCVMTDCLSKRYSLFWRITDEEFPHSHGVAVDTVMFDGEETELSYVKTVCGGLFRRTDTLDRYISADQTIVADFRPSDGRLIAVSRVLTEADGGDILTLSEDEWEVKAKQVVSEYANINEYTFVSCSTDSEKHETTLEFAKYIGEHKTSDKVSVRFGGDGRLTSVEFCDPGAFDNVDSIDYSVEKLEKSISSYMINSVYNGGEGFQIASMSIQDKFVAWTTDGKLVVVSDVKFEMIANATAVSSETRFKVQHEFGSYIN